MITQEERNYHNQVALFNSLYEREVLAGTPTRAFYVELFKEHSKEIALCYKVLHGQAAKPEYHAGYVETVYKSLLKLHGIVFDNEIDHYWSLDELEADSKLFR